MKKLFIPLALALGCFGQGMAEGAVSATVIGDMEFVDMGTSVLWATEPLGVTEITPYGSLYLFGAPKAYPENSYFSIWGMDIEEWGGNVKCDAATATLGSGVLTPSKAMFEELMAICSSTYQYDYAIKRYVLTLTSTVTDKTIRIVGAGYISFGNDHSDAGDVYLYSSTGVADNTISGYCLSGKAASSLGAEKAVMLQNYAGNNAYQILPVFDESRVVKAQSVTLNTSLLTMGVGDKSQLVATVEPAETSNHAVTWSTSDPTVAVVSPEGEVEAVGIGECYVTATTADGSDISATCAITVVDSSPSMEFVDMGLSLLWGKYDIGATSDEETGIYYAWGTVDNAGDYLSAVAGEYKMIPDGPCTAVQRDPADPTKPYDIATELLGGKWHTPNKNEWKELIDNTTVTRENINGVNTACFTSKINGNKIYMRATGYIRETNAKPLMSTSVIRQTSDAPSDYIYDTKYVIFPAVNDLARYCYWLVPVRPVCGEPLAAVDEVIVDIDTDIEYDIYDISGRFIIGGITYSDSQNRLTSGIYIFVSPQGHHHKVIF